jgi:GDPmannose 4,6-dehydratase
MQWLMLQQQEPEDYVIATGETRPIKEFLDEAFKLIGIEDWTPYIKIDQKLIRPAEVDVLRGDYSKAQKQLGWRPKTNFTDLVKIMVETDIKLLTQ